MSVASLYILLLALMAGLTVTMGATGISHARESYLSTVYALSPNGYAAADPMAGLVRAPFHQRTAAKPVPTENCRPAFMARATDPDAPRIECVPESLPTAALRDVRSMTSPVPVPRVVLSRWMEVAGHVIPVKVVAPRIAEWAAMAEFGVPAALPSQAGPLRAGFYSLF